jgi:hypothetical protein
MTKQVEIFKTNIEQEKDAATVMRNLARHFPGWIVNFDLDDCDRILRIETAEDTINEQKVIQLICRQGFACEHLL